MRKTRGTYQGLYSLRKPEKYRGDKKNVVFRSLWERQCFRWCEMRDDVKEWSSEELVIPYVCATDGKRHRYFLDLWIKFDDGKELMVEIKPKSQTQPPRQRKRKTRKYLTEVASYAKNVSKWKAAMRYASHNGLEFQIWTEDTLRAMGIRIAAK